MQFLFSSPHSYLDYTSGAAISTRATLHALVQQGWNVDVFCGTYFDDPTVNERSLINTLRRLNSKIKVRECRLNVDARACSFRLLEFNDSGINASFLLASDSFQTSKWRSPMNSISNRLFFHLLNQKLNSLRPDVFATYGGDPRLIRSAKRTKANGGATVFLLHNLSYARRELFLPFDAIVVPSEYARRYYREKLNVEPVVIPPLIEENSVLVEHNTRNFLTFVNPSIGKGLYWFVGLAKALLQQRPDIPILVVEARLKWKTFLASQGDLNLPNVSVLPNVDDPRKFYSQTKLVIMPSICEESFGRIVVEALLNDIPVIASDRGALAEVIHDSRLKLPIPKRFTPQNKTLPTQEELVPWLTAILNIWNDPELALNVTTKARQHIEVYSQRNVESKLAFFKTLAAKKAHDETLES
jgi:glycosyltransferase involved in cell wall biosynthesis